MSNALLRIYDRPTDAFGKDGYPLEWHATVKHLVREQAAHRCVRCGHPYRRGEHGNGEWSPCDERCTHAGPIRYRFGDSKWDDYGLIASHGWNDVPGYSSTRDRLEGADVEALWRILTVHHLNNVKADCRWWNLAALCQRCHLTIQGCVVMTRKWPWEHTEWFRPYVAGFYAWTYLGVELDRVETLARLDELLDLEERQLELPTSVGTKGE